MDWRRTALTLTVFGLIGLVAGFAWRQMDQANYDECWIRMGDCSLSGGPNVVMLVSAVIAAVGVALFVGAKPGASG